MLRYEMDECVREHVADDAVNVNCVASWRARADAQGGVESLFVALHNSWRFDSGQWTGRADAPARLLRALQRMNAGGTNRYKVTARTGPGNRPWRADGPVASEPPKHYVISSPRDRRSAR